MVARSASPRILAADACRHRSINHANRCADVRHGEKMCCRRRASCSLRHRSNGYDRVPMAFLSDCAAVSRLLSDAPRRTPAVPIKRATIEMRELSAFAAFSGCAPGKPGAIPGGTTI